MVNIITGSVAIVAAIVFLSFYLVRISSVVFWVITIVVMGLAVTDVVKAVRSERRTKAMNSNKGAAR